MTAEEILELISRVNEMDEQIKQDFLSMLPGWMHSNDKRQLAKCIDGSSANFPQDNTTFRVIYRCVVRAGYMAGLRACRESR